MVTVAVLSLGTLLIQQGLLRSADIINHYNNQLSAETWAAQKVWDIRESFFYSAGGKAPDSGGSFTESGKDFDWSLETKSVSGTDQLYFIHLDIRWLEGNKPVNLDKSLYMTANKQSKF